MSDPFSIQQTISTFRANQDLREAVQSSTPQSDRDRWAAQDRADKVRRYKLSLIRGWRARPKQM